MIAEVDKTNLIDKFCDEKDIINILNNVLVNFHYIKVLFIYLEMYIKRLYLTKINQLFFKFLQLHIFVYIPLMLLILLLYHLFLLNIQQYVLI